MPTSSSYAVRSPARRRLWRRRRAMLTGLTAAMLVGILVALGGPSSAEPSAPTSPSPGPGAAGPPIGPATAGTPICTVSDSELDEITGMVATANGIYAVEGGTSFQPSSVQIWTINPTTCEATRESYGFSPIDPQDLALGTDGALWVADIGLGTDTERERLTMERVDLASGADAVPYRALPPATGQINGSAVLLDANNSPIIIANSGDAASLFVPSAPLPADTTEGLPTLQQVGQFRPVNTDTSTPRGPFGRLVVTGAAIAPDRTKVVLRTESDAYEFAVPDGDIVRAITEGTPTITPLPDEENGQAITYSADGTRFLTLTSTPDPVLRAYQPHVPPAEVPEAPPAGGGGGGGLSFGDITTIALVTGFLGLIAVAVGVIGIVRFRRQNPVGRAETRARGRSDDRRRERVGAGRDRRGSSQWDEGEDPYDDGYDGYEDEYGAGPARPPRPRGSTHGAGAGYDRGGPEYGSGTGHDRGGPEYASGGYDSGGAPYGSGGGAGGPVYGSGGGGTTYGSGGTTYGSGGTTYGSSGRSSGSSGRSTAGRGSAPGGGAVYGRPRPDPDDEARHPYGRDNIDL